MAPWKKLIVHPKDEEICDSKDILTELYNFYYNLFTKKCNVTHAQYKQFIDKINVPHISDKPKTNSNSVISLDEISENLFKMNGGKSPGNDGLSV